MEVLKNEHYAGPPISKYSYSFNNERISVYLDKHSLMSFDTKDNFVKQIGHLSKWCGYRSLSVMSMYITLTLNNTSSLTEQVTNTRLQIAPSTPIYTGHLMDSSTTVNQDNL